MRQVCYYLREREQEEENYERRSNRISSSYGGWQGAERHFAGHATRRYGRGGDQGSYGARTGPAGKRDRRRDHGLRDARSRTGNERGARGGDSRRPAGGDECDGHQSLLLFGFAIDRDRVGSDSHEWRAGDRRRGSGINVDDSDGRPYHSAQSVSDRSLSRFLFEYGFGD